MCFYFSEYLYICTSVYLVALNLHYKDAAICNNKVPISDVKGPDIVGRVVFHNYSNVFV